MDNWKLNLNRAAVHHRSKDEPSIFFYVQGMGWPGFLLQGFWFVFSSPSLPPPPLWLRLCNIHVIYNVTLLLHLKVDHRQ